MIVDIIYKLFIAPPVLIVLTMIKINLFILFFNLRKNCLVATRATNVWLHFLLNKRSLEFALKFYILCFIKILKKPGRSKKQKIFIT